MARRIPPLNQLKAFEAAARTGSFRGAGEELNVTHSAISHQVKALEQYFGTPLFHRKARGVEVTDAARPLYGDIQHALDLLAHSTANFKGSGLSGTLRLSVAPSFASRWLLKRLDGFRKRFPSISLEPYVGSNVLDFRRSRMDLAIRHGSGDWRGLSVEKLFDEKLWLVGSPRVANALKSRGRAIDLSKTQLLTAHQRRSEWDMWLKETQGGGSVGNRFISYSTQALALDGAISGLGVALADYRLVEDDIHGGRLTQITDHVLDIDRGFYLVWPKSPVVDAKARAFRDWLVDELP